MAINVQFATGFEEFTSVAAPDQFTESQWSNKVIGWESESNDYSVDNTLEAYFSTSSVAGYLRGRASNLSIPTVQTAAPLVRVKLIRKVNDSDKMVLAMAVKMNAGSSSPIHSKLRVGFRSVGNNTMRFGFVLDSGVWRVGLYKDNVLVSTGTAIDCWTGTPWVYIELFLNKTTNKATITASGVPECSADITPGFIASQVEFAAPDAIANQSLGSMSFDDIVCYGDSDPVGSIKVDGFYKNGDVIAGFNDGMDGGSAVTTGVNSTSRVNYRSSSTPGQEDRFNYTGILPTGVQASSIIAIQQSVIASSSNYNPGKLELMFTSGSSVIAVDVSNKLLPITPQYIVGPMLYNNPETGAPWTREQAQAIQTGYRYKS